LPRACEQFDIADVSQVNAQAQRWISGKTGDFLPLLLAISVRKIKRACLQIFLGLTPAACRFGMS
jgi:hypothetical protein